MDDDRRELRRRQIYVTERLKELAEERARLQDERVRIGEKLRAPGQSAPRR